MRPIFICRAGGFSITRSFYRRLVSAVVTDNSGGTTDTLELTFDDGKNAINAPPEGTVLTPLFGYAMSAMTIMGQYKVTRIKPELGEDGELLTVIAEAADFREALKERQTEHFENTSLGAMLKEVLGRHNYRLSIDQELASIPIGYEARFNQSAADFATRLAERYGAIAKPAGGRYVFTRKGKAASVSGRPLASIAIRKSDCESAEFDIPPRPRHARVVAKWFDRALGRMRFVTVQTGEEGPLKSLQHTYRTEADAKAAAESAGQETNRKTGTGSFTIAGRPSARAEADVIATGFRPEVSGLWRATTITHTFDDDGYRTEVAVEAPEAQKRGG